MQYRNACYNDVGTIDLELEHPDLGWIPFTLSENDPEYQDLYSEVIQGTIEPFVPPSIENQRATWSLPRLVFKAVLLEAGLLEQTNVLIQQLGDPLVTLKWAEASAFPRTDPLIDQIGAALGLSPEAIDQLYQAGMAQL